MIRMENVTRFVVVGADMGGEQGALAEALKVRLMGSPVGCRSGAVVALVQSTSDALDADARVDYYTEVSDTAVALATQAIEIEEAARAEHRKLVSRSSSKALDYLDGNERALGCGGDEQ
jgi:hypothetical protein